MGDGVQQKYKDDKLLYGLMHSSFAHCANVKIVDLVMQKMNITKDKLVELMNYKDEYYIIGQVIFYRTLNRLKKLFELIGQKAFIQNVLVSDGYNKNGLEYAIQRKKVDIIQYL